MREYEQEIKTRVLYIRWSAYQGCHRCHPWYAVNLNAFFFLPFLVELWCSAKHFAVSIAVLIDFLLLFCFYFACIIIATFSVCLSITLIYKLHFFTLTCIILTCFICFILPRIFKFYLNKDLYKFLILTNIYVVFKSPYALCFNITMHYFSLNWCVCAWLWDECMYFVCSRFEKLIRACVVMFN